MNNETKQTAVEWLIQELQKRDMDVLISDLYKQAKEMEKEQIKSAYFQGWGSEMKISEHYYNETYGGNK
jgi:glutamyl-tRNA reductase